MPDDLLAVAQSVRVDALTAEAVTALQAAGIAPVLLKGPVIARRLYPGEVRPYGDADLLVAPEDYARAEGVLGGLGFARVRRAWESGERVEHDAPWQRPGGAVAIDLHRTLPGVRGVAPEEAWRALRPHLEPWTLPDGAGEVSALDDTALALLLCVHVAHHLREDSDAAKPLADLGRGIAGLPAPAWEAARALARALRAEAEMARGLHAAPGGPGLAEALRLPSPARAAEGADGLERWAAARGTRERAAFVARALVPPPAHLRWRSALARRGRAGLALAYLTRPFVLLRSVLARALRR